MDLSRLCRKSEYEWWIEPKGAMRVPGIPWLYAVGDVNGRALLTHQGKYQARAAGDVIVARATDAAVDDAPWGRHVATADHHAVPQVVFSDPEVASVGPTADAARAAGHRRQSGQGKLLPHARPLRAAERSWARD